LILSRLPASSRIKETLRKKFADLANDFQRHLHDISTDLAQIEGPLEVNLCLLVIFFCQPIGAM
jgi:hypothetical protein